MSTDTCDSCGWGMIPAKRWKAMTREARDQARAYSVRAKHRNGQCLACAQTEKRRAGRKVHPTLAQRVARLEDVRWMVETGECMDGAAERLGLTPKALERWLTRHDTAMRDALNARNPRDHNAAGSTTWLDAYHARREGAA